MLQNDIVNIDWNSLTGDAETTKPTVEFEIQRLQETVNGKNSVVILMHDAEAKKATAEALPEVLAQGMGNYIYLAKLENKEKMEEFFQYTLELEEKERI